MSRSHIGSPTPGRNFDREGFEPLTRGDATIEIPLEQVSHPSQRPTAFPMNSYDLSQNNEKAALFHRQGLRHSTKTRNRQRLARTGYDGEDESVTRMGVLYKRILQSSTITRYVVYVLPLGILLAVPIIVGAVAATNATLGGVRIVWFFLWLECCWCGLWVSKIVAHFLPRIFQALCGIVSPGTRKYSLILKALEIPLSLVGWALVSLATFMPIMTKNPEMRATKGPKPDWMYILNRILAAALISSLVFLAERLLIQIITITYHRKQFNSRIKESKHSIHLLSLLYDASRTMFPAFCPEFTEEDAIIGDTIDLAFRSHKKGRSGSSTPMRVLREAGKLGDKVSAAFGNLAEEVTGKTIGNPNSAHAMVVEALEKNRSSEALARRLWLSFVIEGHDALYQEDIIEVLGAGRHAEAEECFSILDRDGNGDVSLDEMILTVAELGRNRQAIANSMHDVDQAIKVLDGMLCVIVFIAVVFVFIAFLNTSFVTTLATTGTALLSLSFVFSVTAQEVLGSCIFLFVKHPYDIGDRIELNEGADQLLVEHISLLFTVFRRIESHRLVQIPNIVLNTLWIENVSRSKAMTEQLSIFVAFDTSLEDLQLLRKEMQKFVSDKQNSRDFEPSFEVEVVGINEMDKLELRVEIAHKSNWANETVRAARRSKFLCALVLALRKVPIYGPGGGDPGLGSVGNPSYSVSISDAEAAKNRDNAAKDKESKRLVPSSSERMGPKSPVDKATQGLGSPKELSVMTMLNERSPALDGTRDVGSSRGIGGSPTSPSVRGFESQEVDEIRGVLRRETTKGRRKIGKTEETSGASVTINDQDAAKMAPASSTTKATVPQIGVTAPTPSTQYSRSPVAGNNNSNTWDDHWDGGVIGDEEREASMTVDQDRMYSNFPPPPGRPRQDSLPQRVGLQHQQQSHLPPSVQYRQQ